MNRSVWMAFLALVVVQVMHSIEEYATRLYDRFAPARFVTGLISDDRRTGFVIFNVLLVGFGLWCWLGPIRRGSASAAPLAWFWVALESFNGTIHIGWAAAAGAYRPGVVTAPLLLVAAAAMAWQLKHASSTEGRAA